MASLMAVMLSVSTTVNADDNEPNARTLTVFPASVEQPLFTYRLFPEHSQRTRKNAALIFLQMIADQNPQYWIHFVDGLDTFLDFNDRDFSSKDARAHISSEFVELLSAAAYADHAEWEYEPGNALVINHFQETTRLLDALAVLGRADIQEKCSQDAIEKIKIGLGCISHLQEPNIFLTKSMLCDDLERYFWLIEQLLGQEDSPNLYWALTEIPDPLIELDGCIDLARNNPWADIPEMASLDGISQPKDWTRLRHQLGLFPDRDVFDANTPPPAETKQSFKRFVNEGRRELPKLDSAFVDRITKMTDDEVSVRYFKVRFQQLADDYVSACLLPPVAGIPHFDSAIRQLEKSEAGYEQEISSVEAVHQVYVKVWWVRRRFAVLRTIEALRDYVAAEGTTPTTLDKVINTPIPIDPVTMKPFGFQRLSESKLLITAPKLKGSRVEIPEIRLKLDFRQRNKEAE